MSYSRNLSFSFVNIVHLHMELIFKYLQYKDSYNERRIQRGRGKTG